MDLHKISDQFFVAAQISETDLAADHRTRTGTVNCHKIGLNVLYTLLTIDGTKPSRLAWLLKEQILPPVYWKAMLKGCEWMAAPEKLTVR